MKYLLVIILCLLASAKVGLQGAFGKKEVKNISDTLLFNIILFLSTSLLFIGNIFCAEPLIWVYAAIYGILSAAFQILYTSALSCGEVSMTVMISNLNVIFPIIASLLFFEDSLSLTRGLGIVLTLSSIVLTADFRRRKKASLKWLSVSLLAAASAGMATVAQKFFVMTELGDKRGEFISCAYVCAALFTAVSYVFVRMKQGEKHSLRKICSTAKYALPAGIILSIFQWFYAYSVRNVEGTFIFPAYSGGTVLLSALLGIIFFGDKLRGKKLLSILLGTAAIVLMNF